MGSWQRAAAMWLPTMTMAPSCRGEFLKKMFMMSRRLISASKRSPLSMNSSIELLCWMTMRAPVFSADMARTASASSSTLRLPSRSSLMPRSRLNRSPVRREMPVCMAKRFSRCRISGWKMMMIARTPTSRRAFSRTVIIRMFRTDATTCATSSNVSTSTMLITVESPRMLRSRKKTSRATIAMSRMSATPNCRKPNMPSTFAIQRQS